MCLPLRHCPLSFCLFLRPTFLRGPELFSWDRQLSGLDKWLFGTFYKGERRKAITLLKKPLG